jgi:hypothetical protein
MTEYRTTPQREAVWRSSTRSSATNCVEVTTVNDGVAVRDSKDRGGPMLRFARTSWHDFVAATKAGEFDLH